MQRLLIFISMCAVFSCNNASITETTNTATDSTQAPYPNDGLDTMSTVAVDTATESPTITPPDPVVKKSASIAYSYFTSIKRKEVRTINVHLNINNPESVTRAQLMAIERSQYVDSETADSNFTATLSMPLFDSVEVSLQDPAGDYTINAINHRFEKQKVDTVKGNLWGWTVLTKTDKADTRLIIKITAFTSGGHEELDNRIIPIRIKLEKNMIRKLWATLLDDPKYFLTIILVPLIGFLGKRYFDRKKEGDKKP